MRIRIEATAVGHLPIVEAMRIVGSTGPSVPGRNGAGREHQPAGPAATGRASAASCNAAGLSGGGVVADAIGAEHSISPIAATIPRASCPAPPPASWLKHAGYRLVASLAQSAARRTLPCERRVRPVDQPPPVRTNVLGEECQRPLLRQLIVWLAEAAALVAAKAMLRPCRRKSPPSAGRRERLPRRSSGSKRPSRRNASAPGSSASRPWCRQCRRRTSRTPRRSCGCG